MASLADETNISWSGTLTLILLWAIGPLIYLGLFIVKSIKQRTQDDGGDNNDDEDSINNSINNNKEEKGAEKGAEAEVVEGAEVKKIKEEEEEEKEKGAEEKEEAVEKKLDGDNDNDNDNWTSTQYLFSLVGYAIGIGNVWRFCYVIAQDGGSASLFAYIISTIFVATPLFMYEMILGQYLRLHAANAWIYIKPRWQGLAVSQFVMLMIVQSYFVMVIGYTVPYMIGSCADPLPWTIHPEGSSGYWFQNVLGLKEYSSDIAPAADAVDGDTTTTVGLLEEVTDLELQWSLVGSLLFVWIVIFFSVSFGKTVLADITYVTVLAPVILMIILIIRTALLPGAIDGISFYIGKFEASKLAEPQVWANALSQCLFSLSPGFGTAITLSSTTKTNEDVYKAAVITSVANTVFAVASGLAVFAMVGNIAYTTGREVADVASTGGQGLAFIVIASAMPTFGGAANALSAMFFFMLFTLGLDSSFCWAETLTASVEDFIPRLTGKKPPASWIISLITCTTCFLIGLPYATTKGNIILDSVDFYVGINFLLLVCFVESVVLNFDFGWKQIEYALSKATSGKRSFRPKYQCCRLDFHILIPVATVGLFLYQMYYTIRSPYLPDHPHIVTVGWVLFAFCFVLLFIGIQDFTKDGSLVPIPDDFPYDGTVDERIEYWSNVDENDDNNNNNDSGKNSDNKKVIAADRDEIGETGDPSSEDLADSNNDIIVDDKDNDNDSVELEA